MKQYLSVGIKRNNVKKQNSWFFFNIASPVGSYLFKFNIRNTRIMCEICSMLTRKTPEEIDVVLKSLLLNLNRS